tara:strand:- start:4391 stop:4633 length:243 start_codon:yes stop_codon:yes gene_type:complete
MEETRPPIKGEYCYYDKMYQAFKRLKIENNVYYNAIDKNDKTILCQYSMPIQKKGSKGIIKEVTAGPFIDKTHEILDVIF